MKCSTDIAMSEHH